MIIVRFTSGLGNQMFQYNMYRYLKERFPDVPVKADVTWFYANSEHQGYELARIFRRPDNPAFVLEEATVWDIICCSGLIPCFVKGKGAKRFDHLKYYPNRILRLFSEKHFQKYRIDQTGFEDNEIIRKRIENLDPKKNWYITGFFIEEVYYKNRLECIRKQFCFPTPKEERNQELLKQMNHTDSVSIHVRRGDYLSAQYQNSFRSLSMEYYQKAVDEVRKLTQTPTFYVFSDDKEYIEKAFDWLTPKVIVTGNSGQDSYKDMMLMSRCKYNIIANSTFSVWAGLLNENPGARVFYPSAYMKEKDSEEKTLEGWIRL